MKKIISFSLYGAESKYINGALCNAELGKIIYPDWVCRFYYGNSVPKEIIEKLSYYENVELILMPENDNFNYMVWRFLAIDDDDVEIMLSRDADSRLSFREKKLVDIFLESDSVFHDIRDHFLHSNPMGGMWGIKKTQNFLIKKLIEENKINLNYSGDQNFLRDVIAPIFDDKNLIHDSGYHPDTGKCKEDFIIQMDEILSPLAQPIHIHHIGEIFPGENYNKPLNHIFY